MTLENVEKNRRHRLRINFHADAPTTQHDSVEKGEKNRGMTTLPTHAIIPRNGTPTRRFHNTKSFAQRGTSCFRASRNPDPRDPRQHYFGEVASFCHESNRNDAFTIYMPSPPKSTQRITASLVMGEIPRAPKTLPLHGMFVFS